jgi:serine/threonine protein kinase
VLELLHEIKHFEEEMAFNIFYQALLAIGYLHKAKVMHR